MALCCLLTLCLLFAMIPISGQALSQNDIVRYSVLILDTSGSMAGAPHVVQNKAAKIFCDSVLAADGTNYIAIVGIDTQSYKICDLTDNVNELYTFIDSIDAFGGTDISGALRISSSILDGITDEANIVKNIVLCSDGLPESGHYKTTGRYTWSDGRKYYDYANAAYNDASSIKEKNSDLSLYTLGFFHSLSGWELAFGQQLMNDIQNAGYYEVTDPDQLEFTFGEIAEKKKKKATGKFRYRTGDERDYQSDFYYDDKYFSKNASEYQASLATMSLCFELSAFSSNETDYDNQAINAKDLLKQCGFDENLIEVNNDYTERPSEDSMGVVIGSKKIRVNNKNYTLVAMATRGGGYEAEWAGNFTIGKTGRHEGFRRAAEHAREFLEKYIRDHKSSFCDDVKVWIAGYSRGGITANLVAADITKAQSAGGVSLNPENIYAYCFEPPQGENVGHVSRSEAGSYTNIHNIVNPNDLVPKVAMRDWGFIRYGVDEPVIPSYLTDSNKEDFDKMFEKFRALNTSEVLKCIKQKNGKDTHILNTFQAKKIDPAFAVKADFGHWESRSVFGAPLYCWVPNFDVQVDARFISDTDKSMETFLNDLMLDLSLGFENRSDYTDNLQNTVRVVVSQLMGEGYEEYKLKEVFPGIFEKKVKSHLLDIATSFIYDGMDSVCELMTGYLLESLSEAGINLAGYGGAPNALVTAIKDLARAVVASLITNNCEDLTTLACNAGMLFTAHYPELCLSWLQSEDSNYTVNGHRLFVIDCYRVVHINCPVDVDVYNADGTLVAEILNDTPQQIANSNIAAEFTSDGEKLVYLPADADYSIKLTATGDGTLTYSVNEYSYQTASYVKNVGYFDVAISSGDTLNATLDHFEGNDAEDTSTGSSVPYRLSKNGAALAPSVELVGANSEDNTFYVSANSDNEKGGNVIGGGSYTKGSYATMTAVPFENCTFNGWYENDQLVSGNAQYRFRVERDVELVAKFTGERPLPGEGANELTFKETEGGTIVTGANGFYAKDSKTPVKAEADADYHFLRWESSNGGSFEDANAAETVFTMPAEKTVVTAVFEKDGVATQYTLSFETNGGNKLDSVKVDAGAEVELKKYVPTKQNYVFDGWCSDSALKNAVTTIKIEKDTTVYAKWKAAQEATQKATSPNQNKPNTTNNSTVQTGTTLPYAVLLLIILTAGVIAFYCYYKKKE